MTQFLISGPATDALVSAIRLLGGDSINENSWIALWGGNADTLCRHLRPTSNGCIVVCALSGDWSYL
jgi:hypothetical protein